jgi:hypothetical protein
MGFRILQECLQFFLHKPISVTFKGPSTKDQGLRTDKFTASINYAVKTERFTPVFPDQSPQANAFCAPASLPLP